MDVERILLGGAALGYGGVVVFGIGNLAARRPRLAAIIGLAFGAAVAAHTAYLVTCWLQWGRAPLANLPEALVVLGWSIGTVGAALAITYRRFALLLSCALIALLTLAGAGLDSSGAEPLLPALRSGWLIVHVSAALVAYGAFTCAFVADVVCLARRNVLPPPPWPAVSLRATAVGFAFLTVGIATGALWANQAWGDYWSWDPKETWSLATWLAYGACLHMRSTQRWSGRRASWTSIVAYGAMLFTFLGVTYLLPSVHGYAT